MFDAWTLALTLSDGLWGGVLYAVTAAIVSMLLSNLIGNNMDIEISFHQLDRSEAIATYCEKKMTN